MQNNYGFINQAEPSLKETMRALETELLPTNAAIELEAEKALIKLMGKILVDHARDKVAGQRPEDEIQ